MFAAITQKISSKSPKKVTTPSASSKNLSPSVSPMKTVRKSPLKPPVETKENGDILQHNVKSKLQRLGKLYSGKLYKIKSLQSNTHTHTHKVISYQHIR